MHGNNVHGHLLCGDVWLVSLNHVSSSIRQVDVGVYSMNQKTNTLQEVLDLYKHTLIVVDDTLDQFKYAAILSTSTCR